MPNYSQLFDAAKLSINQRVTAKNTPESIDPVDVGTSITDILTTLLPIVNKINEFDILGGSANPLNNLGSDGDIYIQDGATLAFWKKTSGSWVLKRTVNLGINIVDGNINLQTRIAEMVVTVSAGQWGINNFIYQKAVQTQFTVPIADINLDRIDAIFADTANSITYAFGTASANPDSTKPTTPNDNIIVSYIYVPNSSSGALPYIADGNSSESTNVPLVVDRSFAFSDITDPDGNPYITLSLTGSQRPFSVLVNGDIVTGFNYKQSEGKLYIQKPDGSAWISGDVINVGIFGGTSTPPTPGTTNTAIGGMAFGSAAALQSYLISKGNSSAIVTNYSDIGGGNEGFTITGITSLASTTFSGSDISVFADLTGWLTGTIGNSCFANCIHLDGIVIPSAIKINLYAFQNCTALGLAGVQNFGSVNNIDPVAFQGATGLNGKTISLPMLVAPNGLGSSPAFDSVFSGITGLEVTIPTAFATNNAGSPDGDLQYVLANGGTVNYI